MNKKTYVLGIDQGLASCGYALIEYIDKKKPKVKLCGFLTTTNKQKEGHRLNYIYEEILNIIKNFEIKNNCKINYIAMEELFMGNQRSSTIVKTNMVTGVLMLLAEKNNINMLQLAPTSVKKIITDNGRADKKDIEIAIRKLVDCSNILFKKDHMSDAIAIAHAAKIKYL